MKDKVQKLNTYRAQLSILNDACNYVYGQISTQLRDDCKIMYSIVTKTEMALQNLNSLRKMCIG